MNRGARLFKTIIGVSALACVAIAGRSAAFPSKGGVLPPGPDPCIYGKWRVQSVQSGAPSGVIIPTPFFGEAVAQFGASVVSWTLSTDLSTDGATPGIKIRLDASASGDWFVNRAYRGLVMRSSPSGMITVTPPTGDPIVIPLRLLGRDRYDLSWLSSQESRYKCTATELSYRSLNNELVTMHRFVGS